MSDDFIFTTQYEIIEPNYYLIYFDILYNCLPNVTDVFTNFNGMFSNDPDNLLDQCDRIQYSVFH
jgi:hypothetical protein